MLSGTAEGSLGVFWGRDGRPSSSAEIVHGVPRSLESVNIAVTAHMAYLGHTTGRSRHEAKPLVGIQPLDLSHMPFRCRATKTAVDHSEWTAVRFVVIHGTAWVRCTQAEP